MDVSSATDSNKYIKKNLIKSNSNKNKYIPNRLSPLPKDVILKKFALSKSKIKKNIGLNNGITSKSSDKNIFKKHPPLKGSISQNPIKKKYIGINSAKSFFVNKKNTQNNINKNNSSYNEYNEGLNNKNICMTDRAIVSKNIIPKNKRKNNKKNNFPRE